MFQCCGFCYNCMVRKHQWWDIVFLNYDICLKTLYHDSNYMMLKYVYIREINISSIQFMFIPLSWQQFCCQIPALFQSCSHIVMQQFTCHKNMPNSGLDFSATLSGHLSSFLKNFYH